SGSSGAPQHSLQPSVVSRQLKLTADGHRKASRGAGLEPSGEWSVRLPARTGVQSRAVRVSRTSIIEVCIRLSCIACIPRQNKQNNSPAYLIDAVNCTMLRLKSVEKPTA